MTKLSRIQQKAVDELQLHYAKDLEAILAFQEFKAQTGTSKNYLNHFDAFLKDFRVKRNVKRGAESALLKAVLNHVRSNENGDVDILAGILANTDITHNKKMKSLCSKILFLNNPWKNFPMDTLTRKALQMRANEYSMYLPKLIAFKKTNQHEITLMLKAIDAQLDLIEKPFKAKLSNLKTIRENRLVDKWLWVIGNQNK